jgi:hypothetical protein
MTLTQKQKRYIAATIVRKTRSLGNCHAFVYYFDGRFDVLIDSKFTDTFHELLFTIELDGDNQPYSQNAIYRIIEQITKEELI